MDKYDLGKFIEFIADLVNEFDIFYEREVDSKYYFLHGGCYELYKIVKHYFSDCQCMISKDLKHCAILYNNDIYDITGKLSNKNYFMLATTEDIRYMERCFGLNVDELKKDNVINEIDKCRVKGILYK